MGDQFSVADAYMFTVLRWSPRVNIDTSKWPNIKAYMDLSLIHISEPTRPY